jgi:ATP synthase F1 complex assembly factor 1
VHGLVLKGVVAETIVSRAASCPFFVQPVFRDDGYFMLVSQFFDPSHFIMAYLEDYKMDPSMAQPLMTFSVFGDYAQSKDLTLVRADVLNFGIDDSEGLTIVKKMIDHYVDDDEYAVVKAFNKKPEVFDIDDYIGRQNMKWKETSKPADVIV